jgi:hypothetical protein
MEKHSLLSQLKPTVRIFQHLPVLTVYWTCNLTLIFAWVLGAVEPAVENKPSEDVSISIGNELAYIKGRFLTFPQLET